MIDNSLLGIVGAGEEVVCPGTGAIVLRRLPGEGRPGGGVGIGVALPPFITGRGGVGMMKPVELAKLGGRSHCGTSQQKGSTGAGTMVQYCGSVPW